MELDEQLGRTTGQLKYTRPATDYAIGGMATIWNLANPDIDALRRYRYEYCTLYRRHYDINVILIGYRSTHNWNIVPDIEAVQYRSSKTSIS